jgi:hypothetical protein
MGDNSMVRLLDRVGIIFSERLPSESSLEYENTFSPILSNFTMVSGKINSRFSFTVYTPYFEKLDFSGSHLFNF